MKFAYHHSMCPPEQYLPLTQAAEELGFDSITMPDSICYPKEASSNYPYNDDGSREFLEGVPFIDPLILTAYLASATKTIRFSTAVMKLAVRQPAVVAKQLTSLAVMTNNRFVCGVGISPWAEDFEACQIPWEKRGQRMDEMLEILNGLMTGEYYGYDGELIKMPEIQLTPVLKDKVPLLIGGHAEPALKRAARLGDGWSAAGGDAEQIGKLVARVHELRKEYGRDHLPFAIHAGSSDAYTADGVKKLQDAGVDEVTVAFRNVYAAEPDTKSVEEKIAEMKAYSERVIAKFR